VLEKRKLDFRVTNGFTEDKRGYRGAGEKKQRRSTKKEINRTKRKKEEKKAETNRW